MPSVIENELNVANHWKLKGAYYTFRAGPTIWIPFGSRFRASVSAGAALVYSPDRLSRKYAYQVLLAEELSRCGVELVFLKAPAGTSPPVAISATPNVASSATAGGAWMRNSTSVRDGTKYSADSRSASSAGAGPAGRSATAG